MSRRDHALLGVCIGVCAMLSAGARGGCGGDPSTPKGPGEPCTRSSECDVALVCSGGVCRVAVDGGEHDGGPPDAGARDAEPPDATLEDAALDGG